MPDFALKFSIELTEGNVKILERLLDFLFIRVPLGLKKRVVLNAGKTSSAPLGKLLLYYKTDSLFSSRLVKKSSHTNDFEILLMVDCFTKMGFEVDLVDRLASKKDLQSIQGLHYEIFISNLAGNSAPLQNYIQSIVTYKKLVAYVMGPEPILSSQLVQKRHDEFFTRTGYKPIVRRLVKGDPIELKERFAPVHSFISNGKNFSIESYQKNFPTKPVYRVPSSISEAIVPPESIFRNKKPQRFLYFGGNGCICKGLDLVLEAFDGLEGVELDVCAPSTESDFWDYYNPLLKRNPHIRYHGFIEVGGEQFVKITSEASFNVFASSSEGCATSVLTAMRMGCIPIVSYESDVDVTGFGFQLENSTSNEIRKVVLQLRSLGSQQVRAMSQNTYLASLEYTQWTFQHTLRLAISEILR